MIGVFALLVLSMCGAALIFSNPNTVSDGFVRTLAVALVVSYVTLAVWVVLHV